MNLVEQQVLLRMDATILYIHEFLRDYFIPLQLFEVSNLIVVEHRSLGGHKMLPEWDNCTWVGVWLTFNKFVARAELQQWADRLDKLVSGIHHCLERDIEKTPDLVEDCPEKILDLLED